MAHVARLFENVVYEICVIDNDKLPNNGSFSPETEKAANEYMHSIGMEGVWKLTSYNKNFRGIYAQIGDIYDEENDVFVRTSSNTIDLQYFIDMAIEAQRELANNGFSIEQIEMATKQPIHPEVKAMIENQ